MVARSQAEIDRLRASVRRVRRWSDRVVGIGPFGLGLDGVLAWIPGAGAAYSLGAGAFLIWQGWRAHAPPSVLARMAALIAADSLTDMIPIPLAPAVADMVFTGHKWAADVLLRRLDETVYYEGTRAQADADPGFRDWLADGKAKWVVYLGDRAYGRSSSSSSAQGSSASS